MVKLQDIQAASSPIAKAADLDTAIPYIRLTVKLRCNSP